MTAALLMVTSEHLILAATRWHVGKVVAHQNAVMPP